MEERLAMKRKTIRQNMKNKSEIIASNRKRLLNNDTPFAIREAYVKLRTGLMFCMTKDRDRACKTIAVTSANPSEGKSLTAANIAISYAMLGKKTLLIDADLRKPTQRRLWKLDVSSGLCDFIAGIWKLELVKVKELPLWIIGAGTIPPNPSELLSSDKATDTLMAGVESSCAECAQKHNAACAIKNAGFIDGTQLSKIQNMKPSAANTSGCRGVSFNKRTSRWEAQIKFRGKRTRLGSYKNFNDAVLVRKKAEQAIFGEFLDSLALESKKDE